MASSSKAGLKLALFGFLLGACSLDTRTNLEDPVGYLVYGLFARGDSLRGQLTVFNLHSAPKGNLAISRCGTPCYEFFHAASSLDGPGWRNGDSVEFVMHFDGDTRLTFTGHDYGDSLTGTMSSTRQSASSGALPTLYLGHFVARR